MDFTVVSVHLDSGRSFRDFDHRAIVYDRFDDAFAELGREDTDVIVLGDFNTMGLEAGLGQAGVWAETEIEEFRKVLASEDLGFELLDPDLACSEFYDGHCGLLDHVALPASMDEAGGATVHVSGLCAARHGVSFSDRDPPAAYRELSDHCPLVVDLLDVDLD